MKAEKVAVVFLSVVGGLAAGGVFMFAGASPAIIASAGGMGIAGFVGGIVNVPLFVFLWCLVGASSPLDDWMWILGGGVAAIGVKLLERIRQGWGGLWFPLVVGVSGLIGCFVFWPFTREDGIVLDLARRLTCVSLAFGGAVMFEGIKNALYRNLRGNILDEAAEADHEVTQKDFEDQAKIEKIVDPVDESDDVDHGEDPDPPTAEEDIEESPEGLSGVELAAFFGRKAERYKREARQAADAVSEEEVLGSETVDEDSSEPDEAGRDAFDRESVVEMNEDNNEGSNREDVDILLARLCGQAADAREVGTIDGWIEFSGLVMREDGNIKTDRVNMESSPDLDCVFEVLSRMRNGDMPDLIGESLYQTESMNVQHDSGENVQYMTGTAAPAPALIPVAVVAAPAIAKIAARPSGRWSGLVKKLQAFIASPLVSAAEETHWFEGHTLGSVEERRVERPDRLIASRLTLCDGSKDRIDRVIRGLTDVGGYSNNGLDDGCSHALRRFVTTLTVDLLIAPDANPIDVAAPRVLGARLALCITRDETLAAMARIKELVAISDPKKEDELEGEEIRDFVTFVEKEAEWKVAGFTEWMSEALSKFALERAQAVHDADDDDVAENNRLKLGQAMALLSKRPELERKMFGQLVDLAIGCDAIDGCISAEVAPGSEREKNEIYPLLMLTRRLVLKIDSALIARFRDPANIARIVNGLNPRGMNAVERVRSVSEAVGDWISDTEIVRKEASDLRERLANAETASIELETRYLRELEEARKKDGISASTRGALLLKEKIGDLIETQNSATACALHYFPNGKTFGVGFIDGMGEVWTVRNVDSGEVELVCERIEATYKLLRIARRMVVAEPFKPDTKAVVRICLVNSSPKTILTAVSGFVFRLEGLLADDSMRYEFIASNSAYDDKISGLASTSF